MSTRLAAVEPNARRVWPPLFLSAVLVVTWALVDNFADVVYTDTAAKMFLMLIVVLGLQIFSGNSGVLSFGHVAFMAVGAYSSALLTIPTAIKQFTYLSMPHFLKFWIFPAQLSPLEGTLAGAGFALVLAVVIGGADRPALRRAGGHRDACVLVIVYVFDVQTSAITRGTSTQIGVPTTTTLFSVFVWALIFISAAFAFQQSRFGLRLRASRENERAAKSVGVHVAVERAIAWMLSGFMVGVAGALYGHYFGGTFGPDDFFFNSGFNIVLLTIAMLVVGGMTSVTGAVTGCYFVTFVYEGFRRWEVNGVSGVQPPAGHLQLRARAGAARDARSKAQRPDGGKGDPLAGRLVARVAQAGKTHDVPTRSGCVGRGARGARRIDRMTSVMRATMWRQPDDLRALLADPGPVEEQAERLAGRRIVAVGTGTSWHAANHAVWLLREAGVEATAVQAMDAALYGLPARSGDAVLVLSHRNTKRFSTQVLEELRSSGAGPVVVIGGRGSPGVDIETVEQERCAAFTASHLGALFRLAQLARAIGAELSGLEEVPASVEAALTRDPGVGAPERLLELVGAGPNQWTAAEGALKVRETSRIATEGLSVEQFFHGPSVAVGERDCLVCLDGGGPGAERLDAVAGAAEACDARVYRIADTSLPEPLSIFPLTVFVQRIALELAEQVGSDPDVFGYDVPGRREAWTALTL